MGIIWQPVKLLCVDDTEPSLVSVMAMVLGTLSSGVRFLGHGDLALATMCLTEARLQELIKQGYFLLKACRTLTSS